MTSTPPRIFADFNNADSFGRLRLNCRGTIDDLQTHKIELQEHQRLIFYMDELETEGIVTYSAEEQIWVAKINWNVICT